MSSINHPDLPSSPPQRRTTKRKPGKAAGSQPLEVEIGDEEPAAQPAKKACKPTKKQNKATLTSNTNEPVNEDDRDSLVADLKKTTGSRSGNYITKEDVQICLSWLETTEDPLNSTNQSGTTFWDRVHGHYMEQVPQYPRSADSVKSRFGFISRLTTKFHGCVKQIILANQSGKTINDQIPAAMKLYAALNKGKDYGHMQCYHILSTAQKWLDYCEQLEQKRLADLKKNNLSSDYPQSDLASDTTAVPSACSDDTSRPPGNKKAKEARVQDVKDTKWKDELIKVNRDLANHSESQSAILAEQKDALVAMSDESTMLIDLDSIPDEKREFFEWRQQKVIEKMKKAKANEARKKKEAKEKKKQEDEERTKKEEEEKKKKEDEDKKKKEEEENEKVAEASKETQKKTPATSKKNIAAKKNVITAKSVPKKGAMDTKAAAEARKNAAEAKQKEDDEAVRRIIEELAQEQDDEEEGGGEGEGEAEAAGEEDEDEDIDIV
ncbi:hypothetical protein PSTG_02993 [Puccinia striiformis f. sp. tritici PST-78]|uniref:No apical meristem-associated C-terminal domain-containing protein n=2 Tax=Puccinia striiformis f. sp. tritici TaxID=168172 RepID=A0A0L0VXH2_9BASI|nr:hypothetical protein PSTG_02993 [Puccinia striiformis f. sp. tritici PST-78]